MKCNPNNLHEDKIYIYSLIFLLFDQLMQKYSKFNVFIS